MTGWPSGPTSRAMARPQGSRRTVTGPCAAILPETRTVAPSLRSGWRKWTGTSVSRSSPWTSKWPRRATSIQGGGHIRSVGGGRRPEDGPAVDADVPGRLAVRPDQPELHRGAPPQRDADLRGLRARPGVVREEGMRIQPPTAPLVPAVEPRVADHLELVILAGRLDRQVAGVRLDGERERAVGFRQGPSAASGAGGSRGGRGEETMASATG